MFSRKSELRKVLNKRVAMNTPEGETLLIGRLAGFDSETYVLEQCETVAAPGETPHPIAGRHYIDRLHGFITELPT